MRLFAYSLMCLNFSLQEFVYFVLLIFRKFPDATEEIQSRVGWRLYIGTSLITGRAQNAEIVFFVGSALADGFDVIDVESHFPMGIERIGLPRSGSAQLTCKAVAFKDFVAKLRRNTSCYNRFSLKCLQDVLTGFKISTINMALDLIAFLVTQFADSASIFTDAADFSYFLRRDDLSDIGNEKCPYSVSRPHGYLSINRLSLFSSRAIFFV
jgi:hypothetical protein